MNKDKVKESITKKLDKYISTLEKRVKNQDEMSIFYFKGICDGLMFILKDCCFDTYDYYYKKINMIL